MPCPTVQLAYLAKRGTVQAIISEDSDILVYCLAGGNPCPVFYKIDSYGNGEEFDFNGLHHHFSGVQGW